MPKRIFLPKTKFTTSEKTSKGKKGKLQTLQMCSTLRVRKTTSAGSDWGLLPSTGWLRSAPCTGWLRSAPKHGVTEDCSPQLGTAPMHWSFVIWTSESLHPVLQQCSWKQVTSVSATTEEAESERSPLPLVAGMSYEAFFSRAQFPSQ